MSTPTEKLRTLVEKMAMHKGKRGMTCRVFAPSAGARTYTVILEYNRLREQFFLDGAAVSQFDRTGNDQVVQNAIRTALHNIERMGKKSEAHK